MSSSLCGLHQAAGQNCLSLLCHKRLPLTQRTIQHDPYTIAYLIEPQLFKGRHINVEIETGSALTLGMTVADWWRVTDRPANATFMKDMDTSGFYALLAARLARL